LDRIFSGTGDMIGWDSSWWLLIGTYNFLIGYVNGFVLRNVYFRQDEMLDEQFDILIENDERLYQYLNISLLNSLKKKPFCYYKNQ
jgi:low-affinity ferrous iron transport protein